MEVGDVEQLTKLLAKEQNDGDFNPVSDDGDQVPPIAPFVPGDERRVVFFTDEPKALLSCSPLVDGSCPLTF